MMEEVFGALASYFGVLAEPTRLKIVRALCHEEQSVSQIVKAVGATQTNVSRHLALMYRAGMVNRRKDGNLVYYGISDPAMLDICRTVCIQIVSRLDDKQPLKKGLLRLVPRARKTA